METGKKSHSGLAFFFGFLTALVVLAAAGGITVYFLYQQYEPVVADKEEKLLEDYTSAIVSSKTKVDVQLDYKYVEWAEDNGRYNLTAHGYATAASLSLSNSEFALTLGIFQSNYNDIANNLNKNPDKTKDLKPNYGAKGIYFIANGIGQEGVSFKSLTVNGVAWTI
jgi:hypothetical protein